MSWSYRSLAADGPVTAQAVTSTGLHWHVMNVTVIEDEHVKEVRQVMLFLATLIEGLHIDENWGWWKKVAVLSWSAASIVPRVEKCWVDCHAPLWRWIWADLRSLSLLWLRHEPRPPERLVRSPHRR